MHIFARFGKTHTPKEESPSVTTDQFNRQTLIDEKIRSRKQVIEELAYELTVLGFVEKDLNFICTVNFNDGNPRLLLGPPVPESKRSPSIPWNKRPDALEYYIGRENKIWAVNPKQSLMCRLPIYIDADNLHIVDKLIVALKSLVDKYDGRPRPILRPIHH